MRISLKKDELNFILTSLNYTKRKFEDYPIGNNGYPTYEFKLDRIREVENLISKLRNAKRGE